MNSHSFWIVANEKQFAKDSTKRLARGDGERSWAYAETLGNETWVWAWAWGQAETWA